MFGRKEETLIEWQVRERLIANETMFEVIGADENNKETYGGLFPTIDQAQQIADKLNETQTN